MVDLSKLNCCDTPYKIHKMMFQFILFSARERALKKHIYYSIEKKQTDIDEIMRKEVFSTAKEFGDNLMALGRS